jgi:hypothetical protein
MADHGGVHWHDVVGIPTRLKAEISATSTSKVLRERD